MAWMPKGWFITLQKKENGWSYKAGVLNLFKVASTSNFRSDIEAGTHAAMLIKTLSWDFTGTGWSKFRSHAVLYGSSVALCGVATTNEPNLACKEMPCCGNCEKIFTVLERCEDWIETHPGTYRYVYKARHRTS